MYQCLTNLLNNKEITQTAFDEIDKAYRQNATPEEVLRITENKIKSQQKTKQFKAFDHAKFNSNKAWLDDIQDPKLKEEAIYDLIRPRNGMPSQQSNVQMTKEYIFGGIMRPLVDLSDKIRKVGARINKPLVRDITLGLYDSNKKFTPDVTNGIKAFQEAFENANKQLTDIGIDPQFKSINDITRISPKVLEFTPDEFVEKVLPLVTDSEQVIRQAYQNALDGEEVAKLTFKSSDERLSYDDMMGSNSFEAIVGYLEKSAAKIAEVKVLGLNARSNLERLIKDVGFQDPTAINNKASKLLDFATGNEKISRDPTKLSKGLGIMRPIGTASMLGSAAVMALMDNATIAVTARMNGIPLMTTYRSMIKMMSKENRHEMAQLGFQLDSVLSAVTQTSRFNPHASANQTMNKVATGVLQLSGLMLLTDIHTLAFKNGALVTFKDHMQYGFQDLASKNSKLQKQMTKYDINSDDWDIVRNSMSPDDLHLNTNKLPAEQRAKFMRMINEESNYAVMKPGAGSAWYTSLGGKMKGTVAGELGRNVTQFKSTIVELILRHVMRAVRQDSGTNKLKYAAEYTVVTTLLGGMIYELKQLMEGKTSVDPIENPKEFLANSLRIAGTIPVVTDTFLPYLISPTPFEAMKGPGDLATGMLVPPTLSQVAGIGIDSTQSIIEAAGGDEDKAMKELTNAVKSGLRLVPGSNIWYAKELYNEYIIDTTERIMNPDGARRRERLKEKEMDDLDQDYLF